MLRKALAILLVVVVAGWGFVGCKDKEDKVCTMDQYRKEAEKTVTPDNAEAELDNIQKEIEADTE